MELLQILLLSTPLSYPLPLLSLTTHLALLSTRLPRLKSEKDEDPLFDDDWDASVFLYPQHQDSKSTTAPSRPPITLLVIAVGQNILFDPSATELAVAEVVLAVSVAELPSASLSTSTTSAPKATSEKATKAKPAATKSVDPKSSSTAMDVDTSSDSDSDSDSSSEEDDEEVTTQTQVQPQTKGGKGGGSVRTGPRNLRLLAVRTIDPPARFTPPGVPNFLNTATGGSSTQTPSQSQTPTSNSAAAMRQDKVENAEGVWHPPVGGAKRKTVAAMVAKVLEKGGVADEVLEALEGVE